MKKLELDPNLVSHIFLTHSDSDHVGGLKVFRNAKVYMSEKEVPLAIREKARKGIYRNRTIKDYITLEDKQTVVVDNTHIQIISTPGHTVGSASYLINNNILFAGDTLGINPNNELMPFFNFLAMDIQENKKSFEMLKDSGLLDKKLILTSHHGIIETS